MGFILFDLLQDGSRHASTIAGWVNTRRPGQGEDHCNDERLARARAAVEALHPRSMQLRVEQIIDESPTAKTLRCSRQDGSLPPFRAGQYISVAATVEGVRTGRPYSVSSRPGSDRLDLTVGEVSGGFLSSYLLQDVRVGDALVTSGPAGAFYHEPLIDGKQLVFLAGGTGITPFMSIIRQAAADDWPLDITLVFGCRNPDEVLFDEELRGYQEATPRFRRVVVLSEPPDGHEGPSGFLDTGILRDAVPDVEGRVFYLCGPRVMVDYCRPRLAELGVPEHKVRAELPGTVTDPAQLPGWPSGVQLATTFRLTVGEKTMEARAGDSLQATLERHGVAPSSLCRSGECGFCRMRLLAGEVFTLPWHGVREDDGHKGYLHCCASYPISDIVITP